MADPKTVFLIFSTGKVVCTGAKNKKFVKEAFVKLNRVVRELGITRKDPENSEYEDISFI
ncbi:MAG: hypothetical protein ACTSPN_03130 [Promethearchaeota archaeon]